MRVPRSVPRGVGLVEAVHLHVFADARNTAGSTVAIAVVEGATGVVKRLLTSKSRISKQNTSIARLELMSRQMAANNLVRNLHNARKRWPIISMTVGMDSMVALYWITNLGKTWMVFVETESRRWRKLPETVNNWTYCPTEKNLADQGSKGAGIHKMETGGWFIGPEWLLDKKHWSDQPDFECTKDVSDEHKPIKEEDHKPNEWGTLLDRNKYWKTLQVTAWALWFLKISFVRPHRTKKLTRPLTAEEMADSKNLWIKKVQSSTSPNLQAPGWPLVKDDANIMM